MTASNSKSKKSETKIHWKVRLWSKYSLITLLVLLVISGFSGCSSWPLPPALSADQLAKIKSFHLSGSVGVVLNEQFQTPSAEIALRQLQATKLFERIDWLEALASTPAYRLKLQRHSWCSNTFPRLWPIISLGVIPDFEGACSGYLFTISAMARPDVEVEIDSTFRGTAFHGWFTVFMNILPDRTFGWDFPEKRDHQRFIDHLAWAIVSKESEIKMYTSSATDSARSISSQKLAEPDR